jgi:hypothetical protein
LDFVMTNPFGFRVARVVLLAAALLMAATGCEKPTVTEMNKPATAGGVQFEVNSYELRYLELADDGKTVEYPEPVLAINVKMTNQGEKALAYTPSHRTQQMTEATTPLLYKDPGAEADLPPASKQTINGVYLEAGKLDEQVTQNKTLNKGESLADVFLFEVPEDKKASLILSLPPSMHAGTLPVLVRIPYQFQQPKGPEVHQLGDAISAGSAEFTVEKASVEYVKTTHTIEGEGYSKNPRLKISYKITNAGEEPLTYAPEHNVDGVRGAALYAGNDSFKRVRLPANAEVEGQLDDGAKIEAGKSVTDFALFERPDKGIDTLVFEYPAARFGGSRLIRVEIPYEYADPELPKELKKAEKAEK